MLCLPYAKLHLFPPALKFVSPLFLVSQAGKQLFCGETSSPLRRRAEDLGVGERPSPRAAAGSPTNRRVCAPRQAL